MTLTKDDITELQQHIDGVLVKSYFVVDTSKVADELGKIQCEAELHFTYKNMYEELFNGIQHLKETLQTKEQKK